MKAPVIDRETAENEVNEWLESKKVFPSTIERHEDSVSVLQEAIMYGVLTFNKEDKSLNHKLIFPLGENGSGVTELKYIHRINEKGLQRFMKGVSPTDGDA